jgi:D-galactarolactone cycloisomerase
MERLRIAKVEALVFRAPIDEPIRTSFGTMHDRPAVLVRIEDRDGAIGWGEIWCNFPSCGAEHRARLVRTVFAPLLLGIEINDIDAQFVELTRQVRILALQSGEPGPLAQVIAGIDTALWDLAARRADQPLWRYLGGRDNTIAVYASGLNPSPRPLLALEKQLQGYRAFKMKVGFSRDEDIRSLRILRDMLGPKAELMADANQAWSLGDASEMATALAPMQLDWLEEPLPVDTPLDVWVELAAHSPIPLAAGENLRGEDGFAAAIGSGALRVIQPDLTKWGGISGCRLVARRAAQAGLTFAPHYLGGAIGLLASGHLLAAVGGAGRLEIDANPNPLRDTMVPDMPPVIDGQLTLPTRPGLGREPDLLEIGRYLVS